MDDIVEYTEQNQLSIEEIEDRMERAEQEGDTQTLAQLVPHHYRMCIGNERSMHIRQAMDDWRIVWLNLWKYSDASSCLAYFIQEAHGDWSKSPRTRLAYANAIQFFKVELGWSFEELVMAGVGKMNAYRTMCENNMVDEEIDPDLKSIMLDTEISVNRVPGAYRSTKKGEEPDTTDDPDIKDEVDVDWKSQVYAYSEGEHTRLVLWQPYPDEEGNKQSIQVEMGYIRTGDPTVAEAWEAVVEGEVGIRSR